MTYQYHQVTRIKTNLKIHCPEELDESGYEEEIELTQTEADVIMTASILLNHI